MPGILIFGMIWMRSRATSQSRRPPLAHLPSPYNLPITILSTAYLRGSLVLRRGGVMCAVLFLFDYVYGVIPTLADEITAEHQSNIIDYIFLFRAYSLRFYFRLGGCRGSK